MDEIIWNSLQNKLENVGQALDGQDRAMEVSAARTMPERGQKALDTYFTQAGPAVVETAPAAPPLQQQQQSSPGKQELHDESRKFFPRVAGQENETEPVAVSGGNGGGQKRPREI